jgi:hypothetical protein
MFSDIGNAFARGDMAPIRFVLVLAALVALVWPREALAWQGASHALSALLAARALPPDTPQFFRLADEELSLVCNDPDRWRVTGNAPTLRALDLPNHWFQLERHSGPLPKTRYEFLTTLALAGKLGPGNQTVLEFGTAPYAISEYAEMLTEAFRHWRGASSNSARSPRRKRQIEQSAIHTAGLLCHYVTDLAQPLHTSVHIFGWNRTVPNPQTYNPQEIHRSIEAFADQCVTQRRISEPHLAKQMSRPRPIADWLPDILSQIEGSNRHVERVFALEQKGLLKSCETGSEAVTFVASRLATGAALLRDVWHAAWLKSVAR